MKYSITHTSKISAKKNTRFPSHQDSQKSNHSNSFIYVDIPSIIMIRAQLNKRGLLLLDMAPSMISFGIRPVKTYLVLFNIQSTLKDQQGD